MARFKVPGKRKRGRPRSKSKNNNLKSNDNLETEEKKVAENELEPMLLSPDQYLSLFGNSDEEEETSFEGFNAANKQEQQDYVQDTGKQVDIQNTVTDVDVQEVVEDVDAQEQDCAQDTQEDSDIQKPVRNVDTQDTVNTQNNESVTELSQGENVEMKNNSNKNETSSEDTNTCNITAKRELNKISYRRSLDTKSSLTDDSNPYKKTYFSYGSRNRRASLPLTPVTSAKTLPPKDIPETQKTATATTTLTPVHITKISPPKDIPRIPKTTTAKTTAATAAKVILNKAHKVKHQKSLANPLKLTIKIEEHTAPRTRRKQKSTFSSDFVYEIGSIGKKRKFVEIKTPPSSVKSEDNISNNVLIKKEDIDEALVDIGEEHHKFEESQLGIVDTTDSSPSKKKKARIKFATSPEKLEYIEKKKVKIKNSSPEKKKQDWIRIPEAVIKLEDDEKDQPDAIKLDKNFFPFPKGKNPAYTEENLPTDEITLEDQYQNKPASKSRIYLRLKVVKINGALQFADLHNRLVMFCKECENCRKTEDCGICGHCRSYCKTIRFLPCWERRCTKPTYGKIVEVNKHKFSSRSTNQDNGNKNRIKQKKKLQIKKQVKQERKEIPAIKKKQEEVELSFVDDRQWNKANSVTNVSEPLQFKVSMQKKRNEEKTNLRSPSGRSNVFTGASPIKPKLRSTMNELVTKSSDSLEMKLPKVCYGPETLVKLPWPNDGHEDAAWVSGHHLCFTSDICFDVHSFCFLCGSGGRGKMVTCQFCCEVFHSYCLDVEPVDKMKWSCDRCKRCTVCGFKENLLMCDKCHDCYHAECLGPFYQRDTEGVEETWVCGKCVQCIKCGRRTAGKTKTSRWLCNFSMCQDCGTNWLHKNYCPVCKEIYQEDDDSLKMMLCSHCDRWIHMECEGITVDDYEILADLPDSIPYSCKLCSGDDKSQSAWYKEVRDEMGSGFLKIYYDLISNRDFKQFKKTLTDKEESFTTMECLQSFEEMFKNIENQGFKSVSEFYHYAIKALKEMKVAMDCVNTFDISLGIFPDASELPEFFTKCVKTIFPWYCPGEERKEGSIKKVIKKDELEEKSRVQQLHTETEVIESESKTLEETFATEGCSLKDVLLEGEQDHPAAPQMECDTDDHCYAKVDEKELSTDEEFEPLEINREKDNRKCLFCNKCGDSEEFAAGRLLFSGMNEWVHINCALWSAEVYEDDSGRLKHVYDAVKRGNKLKCDTCGAWGASIGCCFMKCSRSYHFVCAIESNVVFQDDKKIFCIDHSAKANKSLILTTKELSVPRRVVVDLVRFKSIKRIQRGVDPNSVKLVCGGFQLESLGSLSEKSDQKHALIPVGYRVTRIFWSTKNPRRRCKYTCEVRVVQDEHEMLKSKLNDSVQGTDQYNCTYCHDKQEWDKLLQKTECSCDVESLQSVGSVKRKLYPDPCTKCLANLKYCFSEDQNIPAIFIKEPVKKVEKTREDHNFFPLEKKTHKETKTTKQKASKAPSPQKTKLKMRTAIMGANENNKAGYSAAAKACGLSTASTHIKAISGSSTTSATSATSTFATPVMAPITHATNLRPYATTLPTSATVTSTSTAPVFQQGYTSFEQYKLYRKLLANPLSAVNNSTEYSTELTNVFPTTTTASTATNNNVIISKAPDSYDKTLQPQKTVLITPGSTSKQNKNPRPKVSTKKRQPPASMLSTGKQTGTENQIPPLKPTEGKPVFIIPRVESKPNMMLFDNSNIVKRNLNVVQQYSETQVKQGTTVTSQMNGYCSPFQCLTGKSQSTSKKPIMSPLHHSPTKKFDVERNEQQPSSSSCIKENILIHASKLFNLSSGVSGSSSPDCLLPAVPKPSARIAPSVSQKLQTFLDDSTDKNHHIFGKLYTNEQRSHNKTQPLQAATTFLHATTATVATTSKLATAPTISFPSSENVASHSTTYPTPDTNQTQQNSSPLSNQMTTSIVQPLNDLHHASGYVHILPSKNAPGKALNIKARSTSSEQLIKNSTKVINSINNKSPRISGYQEILPKPPTMHLVKGYPILPASSGYHIVGLPSVMQTQLQPITLVPTRHATKMPSNHVIGTSQQDLILPRSLFSRPQNSASVYTTTTHDINSTTTTTTATSTVSNTTMLSITPLHHHGNKHQMLLLQSIPTLPSVYSKDLQPTLVLDQQQQQQQQARSSNVSETTTPTQQAATVIPSISGGDTTKCIENLINSLAENSPQLVAKNTTPRIEWNFKQEMLLRQLKEYLKKNPNVVNYVENPKSQLGKVPVVNLTGSLQTDNHVYYSAFLPEHLWTELVKSGIARKDISKIFFQANGFVQTDPVLLSSEPTQECLAQPVLGCTTLPSSNPFDMFKPNSVSLISSIKHLHDARLKQQQQQQQQQQFFNLLTKTTQSTYFQIPTCQSLSGSSTLSFCTSHVSLASSFTNSIAVPISSTSSFAVPSLPTTAKYIHGISNMSPRKLLLQESMSPSKNESLMHNLEAELLNHNNSRNMFTSSPHITTVNSSSVMPQNPYGSFIQSPSPLKRKKRIKMATNIACEGERDESAQNHTFSQPPQNQAHAEKTKDNHTGPIHSKRKQQTHSGGVLMDTEIDVCTFDMNIGCDEFTENNIDNETLKDLLNEPTKKSAKRQYKKQRRDYGAMLDAFLKDEETKRKKNAETMLNFVISNEDGWKEEGCSLQEIWKKLIVRVNEVRYEQKLPCFPSDVNDAYDFLGLSKEFMAYLVEQLPGGHKCRRYKFQHHLPCIGDDDQDLPENPSGCARTEVVKQMAERDMFAWLSSAYRKPPNQCDELNTDDELLGGGQDLPTAMKYRFLKNTAKDHVGVYRSRIQGRGLFCKKTIEMGDMIIEYAGEKIRSVLTDKREDYYEKKGYGCYMFRIDSLDVVDATMKGNSARFINHSCDPNCYSRIISVDGCKKIVIFAHRRLTAGEELTYDYKFAQEDDKLPCFCGSKKCRKYLN